jgi:hypothetical protein
MTIESKIKAILAESKKVDEGFLDSFKDSFKQGMRSRLKDHVHPDHHSKYDFDSCNTMKDGQALLKKAKDAGHINPNIKESFESFMEATDINDPSKGGAMNPDEDKNRVGKQVIGGKDKPSNVVTKDAEDGEDVMNDIKTDGVTKIAGDNPDNKKGIKEDIAALVDGEDLTEEFKEKAATIFEAAVMTRVREEVVALDEAYAVKLEEEKEIFKEELTEKIDGYLGYVVEQWLEQNEIALESGMKSDILESFVGGMKSLFEEHYIDVPEEKYDVLGELQEQVEILSNKLDETVASNVELRTQILESEAEKLVESYASNLVETDKEKFLALVEDLEFDGLESFDKKLKTIRESYFTKKTAKPLTESVVTDEPVLIEDTKVTVTDPKMRSYLSTLDRL